MERLTYAALTKGFPNNWSEMFSEDICVVDTEFARGCLLQLGIVNNVENTTLNAITDYGRTLEQILEMLTLTDLPNDNAWIIRCTVLKFYSPGVFPEIQRVTPTRLAALLEDSHLKDKCKVEWSCAFTDFYNIKRCLNEVSPTLITDIWPPVERNFMALQLMRYLVLGVSGLSLESVFAKIFLGHEFCLQHHLADVDAMKAWRVLKYIFDLSKISSV